MYVRVVTVQVQPGKMDEVWRRIREAIPTVQAIRGFREARFLTDAHTDTVLGVTLWETEADAKAAPVAGAEGGRLRDLLTKPAVVAYYELSMGFARDTDNF
jgi:heme-degrading monooxygenase HmoA